MRRGVVLATMVCLVVLLLGLLGVLSGGTTAWPEVEPSPTPTATATYAMLYQRALQDFTGIEVQLRSGERFSLTPDMVFDTSGRLLGVRNSLAQPLLVDGQESFALAAISYQMMLLTAQNLPYTAAYDSLDRAACGLDNPMARITLHYQGDEDIVLSIGEKTSSDLSCYVSMEGDARVLLVPYDFYDVMTLPLSGHHALPGALTKELSTAVQLAVVPAEGERIMAVKQDSSLLPWQVEEPFQHSGSTERIEVFLTGLCAISAETYVTTVQDADGLAAYGLMQPLRLLVVFSDGSIRDISVGDDAQEGMVYVRMDRTGDVYLISRTQLDFLDDVLSGGLLDRFVALIPADTVTCVTISGQGGVYALIQAVADEADAYTLNGEVITASAFTQIYRALVGLQFDKLADDSGTAGETLLRVTFQLTEGGSREICFSTWNHHYVLAETDGGGALLLRQEKLDALLEVLSTKEETP